jgi:hypothetical protein
MKGCATIIADAQQQDVRVQFVKPGERRGFAERLL